VPADSDHVNYLLVVLQSAGVLAEEQFDYLALNHLRPYRATGRLAAIKAAILDSREAYRLTLRGRAYLARIRRVDLAGNPPRAVAAHDVERLLDTLARLAGDSPPGKPGR
jgi:hypothetical protein